MNDLARRAAKLANAGWMIEDIATALRVKTSVALKLRDQGWKMEVEEETAQETDDREHNSPTHGLADELNRNFWKD